MESPPKTKFIDYPPWLPLVLGARKLLEELIDARGIRWFLAPEGRRLVELEKSKVELIVAAAANERQRAGRRPHPEAIEHCRAQIRRELIRKVALAMIASGC